MLDISEVEGTFSATDPRLGRSAWQIDVCVLKQPRLFRAVYHMTLLDAWRIFVLAVPSSFRRPLLPRLHTRAAC